MKKMIFIGLYLFMFDIYACDIVASISPFTKEATSSISITRDSKSDLINGYELCAGDIVTLNKKANIEVRYYDSLTSLTLIKDKPEVIRSFSSCGLACKLKEFAYSIALSKETKTSAMHRGSKDDPTFNNLNLPYDFGEGNESAFMISSKRESLVVFWHGPNETYKISLTQDDKKIESSVQINKVKLPLNAFNKEKPIILSITGETISSYTKPLVFGEPSEAKPQDIEALFPYFLRMLLLEEDNWALDILNELDSDGSSDELLNLKQAIATDESIINKLLAIH